MCSARSRSDALLADRLDRYETPAVQSSVNFPLVQRASPHSRSARNAGGTGRLQIRHLSCAGSVARRKAHAGDSHTTDVEVRVADIRLPQIAQSDRSVCIAGGGWKIMPTRERDDRVICGQSGDLAGAFRVSTERVGARSNLLRCHRGSVVSQRFGIGTVHVVDLLGERGRFVWCRLGRRGAACRSFAPRRAGPSCTEEPTQQQ